MVTSSPGQLVRYFYQERKCFLLIDQLLQILNQREAGSLEVSPISLKLVLVMVYLLLQILNQREAGSLVVSPISLKLVLAMVYEGATNQTAVELRSALDLPEDRVESRKKYHRILESLEVTILTN